MDKHERVDRKKALLAQFGSLTKGKWRGEHTLLYIFEQMSGKLDWLEKKVDELEGKLKSCGWCRLQRQENDDSNSG